MPLTFRNIGFRMETVYADGIRMFGFSPKLNKFSGSFSSADSNEKICFTSVDYSSKVEPILLIFFSFYFLSFFCNASLS